LNIKGILREEIKGAALEFLTDGGFCQLLFDRLPVLLELLIPRYPDGMGEM